MLFVVFVLFVLFVRVKSSCEKKIKRFKIALIPSFTILLIYNGFFQQKLLGFKFCVGVETSLNLSGTLALVYAM